MPSRPPGGAPLVIGAPPPQLIHAPPPCPQKANAPAHCAPPSPSPRQLLLVPAQPPGGAPPVLLGYPILFNWQGPGAGGPCVAPGCGLTLEEAKRCLNASPRTIQG